jgi:hypothetical protein
MDVVGVLAIVYEYVVVSLAGWDGEAAGLVGVYFSLVFNGEDGGVALVGSFSVG